MLARRWKVTLWNDSDYGAFGRGRRAVLVLAVAGVVPVLSLDASAQGLAANDAEGERVVVSGDHSTLCVWIDAIDQQDNRTSVTTEVVRNRTEVRLRSLGIRPMDVLDNLDSCFAGRTDEYFLQVKVAFSGNAYLVSLDFVRHVVWWVGSVDDLRDGPVPTRQDIAFGVHDGSAAPVLEALDAMLDQFLNTYLKANQR